ncbi:MAG: MATE family efflux transporter [Pseudomonadota bacterium]|nr:MATE family efflux transporter [Pseudomonadota bacterium]
MSDIFLLPPARLLLRLLIPIALGFTMLMCIDFADVVIARMISNETSAVLGYCYPLLYFMIAIGFGLNQGLTIVGSEEKIKHGMEALYHYTAQSCYMAVLMAMILSGGTVGLLLFQWIDVEMLPYFDELSAYLYILLTAIIPMFLLLISCAVCQIKGKPEVIRDTLLLMLALTMICHPVFALPKGYAFSAFGQEVLLPIGYDLGLVGIALSKSFITFVGFAFSVIRIIQWDVLKQSPLGIRLSSISTLARQTLPASGIQLLVPVYLIMLTKMVTQYGVEAIAGFSLGYRIVMVVIIPVLGVLVALLVVITHDMVSRNFSRVRETLSLIITWGLGAVLLVLVGAFGLTDWLFSGLSDISKVEDIALQYLKLAIYITIIEFLIGVFTVSFQSVKQPAMAFLVQATRTLIFPAPIFFALSYVNQLSITELWYWVAVSFTLAGALSGYLMYQKFWKKLLT